MHTFHFTLSAAGLAYLLVGLPLAVLVGRVLGGADRSRGEGR